MACIRINRIVFIAAVGFEIVIEAVKELTGMIRSVKLALILLILSFSFTGCGQVSESITGSTVYISIT